MTWVRGPRSTFRRPIFENQRPTPRCGSRQNSPVHVRYGSQADIRRDENDVRFVLKADVPPVSVDCLLGASVSCIAGRLTELSPLNSANKTASNVHVNSKWRLRENSLTEQPAAERELSIATMEPTLRQQRLALAIIGMLCIGFAAIAPFAAKQVVQVGSFVPTVEAIIFVTSLTTAVLLFSQFSILGLRELLLLASGYLFTASIVIPHALSYPGAFAPQGLLGPGIQATPWLYTFWHFGFSAAVLGYACLLIQISRNYLFTIRACWPFP